MVRLLMRSGLLPTVCLVVSAGICTSAEPFEWVPATSESQGMSAEALESLRDDIAEQTHALLVIRNDRIVHEWYPKGRGPKDRHSTASLAKAIVGGLSLAVAMQDARISPDDPAWKYVPAWKDDPVRSKILVSHLGSHTSGIDDSHNREERTRGIDQGEYTGWSGEFWRWRNGQQRPPHDAFTISRDVAPVLFDPGKDFQYSNPGMAMLSWCVTASLQGTEHPDLRSLLKERIMQPIGVPDDEWSCGYGMTETVEGLPMVANWGGGNYTPRAVARIGRLVLQRGEWDGQRLLSPEVVDAMTNDAGFPGHCGMGWWTNADGRYAELPRDAVWGAGAGHQILLVVPSLNLIVVRNGSELPPPETDDAGSEFHSAVYARLFRPLMRAVTGRTTVSNAAGSARETSAAGSKVELSTSPAAPYPPSPLIESVTFDFSTEQVFGAGSDQWPMTWSGDGQVYAAWGDGWGWDVRESDPKHSIGVTRIVGTPGDLHGEDLWGDGPGSGFAKPEALLALDTTLYMFWTRGDSKSGTDDTATAISRDAGLTWTYGEGKAFPAVPEGFRVRGICQFGPGYKGATDDHVYVYFGFNRHSDLFLGRVPREKLFGPESYQWFTRLREDGQALWSSDFASRQPVFHDANAYIWHIGVSYHPALRRFLLTKPHYRQGDDRETDKPSDAGVASFGLFDAPHPWGPWTTIAYEDKFKDDLVKFSYFIPTKFLSDDGRTFWLAWSGWPEYDSVSLVQGRLKLRTDTDRQ